MKKAIAISDAEWEVMRVVWERSPKTTREIVDAVGERRGWTKRTIRTLVDRLVKKGALSVEKEGVRFLYSPGVSERSCVRKEVRSFVDRVFGGCSAAALLHMVDEGEFSADEIEQLRRLLNKRRDNDGGQS